MLRWFLFQTQAHHLQRGKSSFSKNTKGSICFTQCQNLDVRLKAITNFVRAAPNCCCLHYPCHSARIILSADGPQHPIIPKSKRKCQYQRTFVCCARSHMLWLSPCNSSLPLYSPLCSRNLLSWVLFLSHHELCQSCPCWRLQAMAFCPPSKLFKQLLICKHIFWLASTLWSDSLNIP